MPFSSNIYVKDNLEVKIRNMIKDARSHRPHSQKTRYLVSVAKMRLITGGWQIIMCMSIPFVWQLLNRSVSGITLDTNYKELIENFLQSFEELHEKFNESYTNKIHIIESHLEHYLNESKKSLGYYSDQMIEAMHAEADKILNNSGYKIKDLDSDICGEKLENFVHHLNSYNLTAT